MGKKDPRVDAYIAKSPPFARPVLKSLRAAVHAGCPDVEETLKWGAPWFVYKGLLVGMATFKEHCAVNFWKGKLVVDDRGRPLEDAMGQFGRLTKVADLPAKTVLVAYVRKAAAFNDAGIPSPTRSKRKPKPPLAVPPDLAAALRKNRKAKATFDDFSPSHRREYIEWITEARTETTRTKRLETAIAWMAEGKPRMWKYMK